MTLQYCDICKQRKAVVRCLFDNEKGLLATCWKELCAVCMGDHVAAHIKEANERQGAAAQSGV